MSGIPAPPKSVLDAERERVKAELDLETMRSNLAYQKQYQKFLRGEDSDQVVEGKFEAVKIAPAPTDDYVGAIKKAYSEAYALRAFREVMDGPGLAPGVEKKIQSSPGTNIAETLIKGGVSAEDANKWLSNLSPQALGALIALQSGNPQLAQIGFAMGQGNQGLTIKDVLELNKAISPNMNIDFVKLIEAVKNTGSNGLDAKEVVSLIMTGVNLANSSKPQGPPPKDDKGYLEKLIETPNGLALAKEMGLIGNDASQLTIMAEMRKNDQIALRQQKESDRQWDLRLEEMKLKRDMAEAKAEGDNKRTDMIMKSLQNIGKAIAAGLAGEDEIPDEQTANQKQVRQQPRPPQVFTCEKCQTPIQVPPGTKAGTDVECPKCHEIYTLEQ